LRLSPQPTSHTLHQSKSFIVRFTSPRSTILTLLLASTSAHGVLSHHGRTTNAATNTDVASGRASAIFVCVSGCDYSSTWKKTMLIGLTARLLESGNYSDFKIIRGSDTHLVHKAVIFPRSEYFANSCKLKGRYNKLVPLDQRCPPNTALNLGS
jgi:hypothetical protein